jgi:hypothetical protein
MLTDGLKRPGSRDAQTSGRAYKASAGGKMRGYDTVVIMVSVFVIHNVGGDGRRSCDSNSEAGVDSGLAHR